MATPLPFDLPLAKIDEQEGECILMGFNADYAFELGSQIRERAKKAGKCILIDITTVTGLTWFRAASGLGTNMDNQQWVARKRNAVIRFGRSSFFLGCNMRQKGRTLQEAYGVSDAEYAAHGGAFPIRVNGVEGPVAVVTVSGLPQFEDHTLVHQCLRDFAAQQRKELS